MYLRESILANIRKYALCLINEKKATIGEYSQIRTKNRKCGLLTFIVDTPPPHTEMDRQAVDLGRKRLQWTDGAQDSSRETLATGYCSLQ